MFNLLTAEKIKVWESRKMWVSLGLMVVLPLFYSWNEWYMHTKYGNELNQATDTVINGATGILMVIICQIKRDKTFHLRNSKKLLMVFGNLVIF